MACGDLDTRCRQVSFLCCTSAKSDGESGTRRHKKETGRGGVWGSGHMLPLARLYFFLFLPLKHKFVLQCGHDLQKTFATVRGPREGAESVQ